MRCLFAFCFVVVLAIPASAQPIDARGAAELTDMLSRYVGRTAFDEGVVAVTADGDAYRIDVELDALAPRVPAGANARFDIERYSVRVRPLADGTWQVDGDLLPSGWVEMTVEGQFQRVEWTVSDDRMTGVYDPALDGFSSSSGSYSGMSVIQRMSSGESRTAYGAGSIRMAATKSAGDGIDVHLEQKTVGYSQIQSIQVENSAKLEIAIKAASLSIETDGKAVRPKPLLDLLAFAVAHPDAEKIKAAQGELKPLLIAALPLWERMDARYTVSGVEVTTPFGILRAGDLGSTFALDWIGPDGRVEYGTTVSELTVASVFMPKWATKLMPTRTDMDVSLDGFDLDKPARKLIETFDLNQMPPIPESVTNALGEELMANGVDVSISRLSMGNAASEVIATGSAAFSGASPMVDLTFDATGYDEVVKGIEAAASIDQAAASVLPAAQFLREQANTAPGGHLKWRLFTDDRGTLWLNNFMLKAADPVEQ